MGFNAGATGEFTIVRIDLDESGNSIFGYTADVGRQGNGFSGDEQSNEYFEYALYKSSLTPPTRSDDPNRGKIDLGREAGGKGPKRGAKALVTTGVEAMTFAYAFDNDNDTRLDSATTSSASGVIWAIDANNDNLLDSSIDSNFDGVVGFGDRTEGLASVIGVTDVPPDKIRAIKVWILLRSGMKLSTRQDPYTREYYVGNRRIQTGGSYSPYYERVLFTFTVHFRNMGLQHD
ncbi:MAG: hypothetical protein GY859_13685 [Desulfobacterales bacterium]|nr:hypothetical protein [Desulfobacterales bacterium]